MMKPIRKKDLVFNKLNDQMIIINFNSSRQFHQANEVGSRIWELCDGNHSQNQILDILVDEFEESPETIKNDLIEYLALLKKNELLDY